MKKRGFTLIELLVVISIIGLLIAIMVPAMDSARRVARRAACRNSLHSVSVGFRMYMNDSNDIVPMAAELPSANLNSDPRICDVLAPYISDPKVFQCPADRGDPTIPVTTFFDAEGSSYEFNSMLGGKPVSKTFFTKRYGESRTYVMYDYEPFHGPAGQLGSANFLFADCHVGDME